MKLLKEIKNKILFACPKVKRIYLFGSRANGEFNQRSDFDIAVEGDCDIKRVLKEIESINTLYKIDVIKLEDVNERLKERIKASKVIYSSNKFLRFEDSLSNFEKAYYKFEKILNEKEFFLAHNLEEEFREIAIKRFEYTYESSWKALKRYLDFLGIVAKSPRGVFKEAFGIGIIDDEEVWLLMIEDRNYTSHVYDDFMIRDIESRLERYKEAFGKLIHTLRESGETL